MWHKGAIKRKVKYGYKGISQTRDTTPYGFYVNSAHVKLFSATLFPPFSLLSSLSSLKLSSPINLQEKERYDKLTYESQSILLSPSLKDLSL